MKSKFDALITDANQRVALEVVRCLGRKDLKLLLVEQAGIVRPLAFVSQYASCVESIPSYQSHRFKELCDQTRTIFPISTNTHLAFYESGDSELLEKCLLPSEEIFRKTNNKAWILEQAHAVGIAVPQTRVIDSHGVFEVDKLPFSYPIVIKLQDDEGLFLAPDERYQIARNKEGLSKALEQLKAYNKPLLIQEFIPGEGVGFSGICNRNSDFVSGIGHHRLREIPPEGGPSTFCESIQASNIERDAARLLRRVNWMGPAMVEFRKDQRDGQYKLMEINPRYWGSLPLARAAGLNLPYLHYCILTNNDWSDQTLIPAKEVKLKFILPDLLSWTLSWWQRGKKIKHFVSYFREWWSPSNHFGIWDRSDWKPFVRYIQNKLFKKL